MAFILIARVHTKFRPPIPNICSCTINYSYSLWTFLGEYFMKTRRNRFRLHELQQFIKIKCIEGVIVVKCSITCRFCDTSLNLDGRFVNDNLYNFRWRFAFLFLLNILQYCIGDRFQSSHFTGIVLFAAVASRH